MKPESTNAGSGVEKSRPGAAQGSTGKGTSETEPYGTAESIERGRQIAVSMMDRAEAKYRHEHGQPHTREHCETCAEEYWSNRLRPVHYTEAARSLRRLDQHAAATLLESVARDFDEEAADA
ncbi:hypothetical protein [Glycomyces sp. NPDC021274]|uniref:hypothetical protein n=1 Tax=Glycomyces sp. NPDC021274 TaxID=3155120 RepID=UPI0033E320E3